MQCKLQCWTWEIVIWVHYGCMPYGSCFAHEGCAPSDVGGVSVSQYWSSLRALITVEQLKCSCCVNTTLISATDGRATNTHSKAITHKAEQSSLNVFRNWCHWRANVVILCIRLSYWYMLATLYGSFTCSLLWKWWSNSLVIHYWRRTCHSMQHWSWCQNVGRVVSKHTVFVKLL